MGMPLRFGTGRVATFGYLAEPGPHAVPARSGVVVLHDWYGHLPHVRAVCDRLADAGHLALAPDLYDGRLTADPLEAQELFETLDEGLAKERIRAGVEHLRALGARRVGALGYSIGGWLALQLGQRGVFEAIVAYYAALEEDERAPIPCPVLLHLAELDDWDAPDAPQRFADELRDQGTRVEVVMHAGARHAFANEDVAAYDLRAATLAWPRTMEFLGRQLFWAPPP